MVSMSERWKPSVTVAAIIERDGRYLLIEEHTPEGLRLNNPAGHLDPGEGLVEACVREVLEETAHHFRPTHLVGMHLARFQRGAHDITYLRFAFTGELGEHVAGLALDTGIVRTLWMTYDEIAACRERHRSPALWQCIEDHASGRRYPLDAIRVDSSIYHPPLHGA